MRVAEKPLPNVPIPEALRNDVEAFREALGPRVSYAELVRTALRYYIDARTTEEATLRERYEAARNRRIGTKDLHLVK
jgi:Arc/MetJ-type ribon-helix-helix transcriptional regulator